MEKALSLLNKLGALRSKGGQAGGADAYELRLQKIHRALQGNTPRAMMFKNRPTQSKA